MLVEHLTLRDFRSYEAVDLALDEGTSVFLGANGQGKTNLVEALAYLATLSSHRVATNAPLVRRGAASAHIGCLVRSARGLTRIDAEINASGPSRGMVNSVSVRGMKAVLGHVKTVLFAPEDISIVKADPQGRRAFLDQLLVQLSPRLAGVIADYERVCRQRATLLKSAAHTRRPSDLPTLDAWDAHLARHGAALTTARLKLVADIAPLFAQAYEEISESSSATIAYQSSLLVDAGQHADDAEELILAALAEARPKEVERGVNLVGPHRDDLAITISGVPARGYASHGEAWSAALALRRASFTLLSTLDEEVPILIYDDVFAELDSRRRAAVARHLQDAGQVLITCAVPDDLPPGLIATRFEVAKGRVGHA